MREAEKAALQTAVESIAPSVVTIETIGGREKIENVLVGTGPFPGLVVGEEGYIVSSSFHFVQDPTSILVTTPGGKRIAAKIVARDRACMLVLLKIVVEEKLVVPAIAPRAETEVGETAIAVGRTFGGEVPVARGIVSALHRVYGRAIQYDTHVQAKHYGGPLIDLQGRVLGVITPLTPQGSNELQGAEWYDSGIGFAVPLDGWLTRLEVLKRGQDLLPGMMGIAFKPGDMFALPAEIAVSEMNSPAYKAGLRSKDRIIEIDGAKIERQVQVRHALGKHYAGDKMHVVALREQARLEFDLELVDHLEPAPYSMLGILPSRNSGGAGIGVRYVFPASPAEAAGIKPADRILEANGIRLEKLITLQGVLAGADPLLKLPLKIQRGTETLTVEVSIVPLATDLPISLLPEKYADPPPLAEKPATGLLTLKLPEEKQECFAYVPGNYHPAIPQGLVVWIAPPGEFDKRELEKRWQELSEKFGFIVIAPRPGEAGQWQKGEVAVVRKFIEQAIANYNIDRARVIVYGRQASGSMAWLTALANRNLIRGVAVVDAPFPERVELTNDPVNRLFAWSFLAKNAAKGTAIEAGQRRLQAAKIPLITTTLEDARDLNAVELTQLAQWLVSLDRL